MVPLLRRLCAFETCAPCVFGVWPFSTLLRQLCALGILWSWLCLGFLPQCYKLEPCVCVTFLAVLAAGLVLVPGDLFPSEQACLGVSSRVDVVDFVLTPGDFYPAGPGVLLFFVLRSSRKWLLYLWVFFWLTHPTLLPHTSILKPHCNSYLLLQTSWHDSFSGYRLLCRSFLDSLMHALCAAIAIEPAHAVMGYTSISTRVLIICLSLEASRSFVPAMGPTHLNDSYSYACGGTFGLVCILACFLCSQRLRVAGSIDRHCDYLDNLPTWAFLDLRAFLQFSTHSEFLWSCFYRCAWLS